MSNVSELIRSANPVPETNPLSDDEVNAVLTLTLTRSGDMDVKEIVTPVEPDRPKWNGWLVAAASFGVVVLVAGVALLVTRSTTEDLPPASTPTTVAFSETTVAEDEVTQTTTAAAPTVPPRSLAAVQTFVAAMSSGDEEALHASVGPSFVYSGLVGETVFNMEDLARWSGALAAQQTTITVDTCTAGAESTLSCNEFHNGPVESTYGIPVQWSVHYEIVDGLVASASAVGCTCPQVSEVQKEIRAWVRTFDPDQAELLTNYPVFPDAAAGAAFLKYAPMWSDFDGDAAGAESLGVISAFEAAWNAGDGDALEPLFTPGITISDGSANTLSFATLLVAMASDQAKEQIVRIEECRPSGELVICEVYGDGPVGEALYGMPGHSRETYKIVDGQFVEFKHTCVICPGDFENKVIAWVRTISPADFDQMRDYEDNWMITGPSVGALWLKYAPLWDEAGRP